MNSNIKEKNMTGKILNIKRIEETSLWQKLSSLDDKNTAPLIGQSRPRKIKTLSNTINSLFTKKIRR